MTIEETGLDDERHARKRAAVALASIVGVAVVVVTLLVALTGRPPKSNPAPGAQDVPVATSVASSSSRAQPSTSSSAATAPSSRRAASRSAPVPAGDTGRVLQAFNTFRSRHGVRPVSGSVTSAAIDCAASQGDPSSCPSSYFWEPVPSADGAQVVEKISRHSQGTDWLLDPRIKRLEIGWKPAGGSWDCAVVATY
jgi:hypothetical protein